MQTYTGINLTQFFNQWFYGQGYPTFDVKWNQTGGNFILQSIQTQSMPSSVPLFITDMDYRVSRTAKPDTVIRLNHANLTENYIIPLSGTVTAIAVDPSNWILNKTIGPVKDPSLNTSIGIEELSLATVFIGPNPTSDVLNVYLYNNEKATVEILDLNGKLISTQNMDKEAQMDVSKYSNGIYNVIIKNNQGEIIKTSKVVKN